MHRDMAYGSTRKAPRGNDIRVGGESQPFARRGDKRRGVTSHSNAVIEAVKPFPWIDKYPPTSALTQEEARAIADKWGAVLKG